MRKILLFTVMIVVYSTNIYGQTSNAFDPVERDALLLLYDSAGGKDWRFGNGRDNSVQELRKRKESPFYKMVTGSAIIRNTRTHIQELNLTNNNLSGALPDSLFECNPAKYGFPASMVSYFSPVLYSVNTPLKFGHNSLRRVSSRIGYTNTGAVKGLFLDHNFLTGFGIDKFPDNIGGLGGWGVYGTLDLSNNLIRELTGADFSWDPKRRESGISSRIMKIDIANNLMDFQSLLLFEDLALKSANRARPNFTPAFVKKDITVWPQRKLGEAQAEMSLDKGQSHELSFSLRHAQNKYSWLLNGKPMPLSDGKTFTIKEFDTEKAGVYTCRVTNPAYPDQPLESVDFALWLNKPGNKAPTSLAINNSKAIPHTKLSSVVGTLTGVDPDGDALNFRLVEGDDFRYNSSFRIIEGNTLVTAEEIFEYPSLKEYKIRVEAYDPYGGKFRQTITVSRLELPEGVTLIESFLLSKSDFPENEADFAIGEFALKGNNKNLNGEYAFTLPEGQQDNALFSLEGNTLKTKSEFNFEKRKDYSVSVKATHKTHADIFQQVVFKLKVTDANDAPTLVAISGNLLKDTDPAGTEIGQLFSADEDPADLSFTFALTDKDSEFFVIHGSKLKNKKRLTAGVYKVGVSASDSKGASVEATISVVVQKTGDGGEVVKTVPEIKHFEDISGKAGSKIALTAYSTSDAKLEYELVSGQEFVQLNDGELSLVKAGTAELKASVPETDSFKAGEKTIHVKVLQEEELVEAKISHLQNMVLFLGDAPIPLTGYTNSEAKIQYEVVSGAEFVGINPPFLTVTAVGNAKVRAYVSATDNFTSAEAFFHVKVMGSGRLDAEIENFEDLFLTTDMEKVHLSAHSESDGKVYYELLSGEETIALENLTLTIKAPGLATVKAYTSATSKYNGAEKIITVKVAKTLSVDDFPAVTASPNPTERFVTVTLPRNSVTVSRIFDTYGHLINTEKHSEKMFKIDLEGLPLGIYTLSVTGEGIAKSIRIIKK
ncbi:hypothetical protein FUAX_04820 [Fulvitalea axinellae]|uniref:T9SS type A sorting domain-containing protein n=1 Tax=Fulvitalea axinellae TaxID=1182444 RepID=A0AAU9DB76_9BACT|nr:hypothetical protein FUAX_04820 [Fulvitalea axinellae]